MTKFSLVVLDTNVFVAAGFNPGSASAQIVDTLKNTRVLMIWNAQTRQETAQVVQKIPPLAWTDFEELFRAEGCFKGPTAPEAFDYVPDPDDRKFAALAGASNAPLVTLDDHLLGSSHRMKTLVLRPKDYLKRWQQETNTRAVNV